MQSCNDKQQYYQKLSPPLPIQLKRPIQVNSILPFLQQPPESINITNENLLQELAISIQPFGAKRCLHEIGNNFKDLFKQCIYRNHNNLQLNDNETFCSCKLKNFTRNEIELNDYHNLSANRNGIQFTSNFESGNLALVSQQSQNSFYLCLQRDYGSNSATTQWFYYSVKNYNFVGLITFHIINFIKPYSSFQNGMKPTLYSTKSHSGWRKGGFNITYKKNTVLRNNQFSNYYTLSFSYTFQNLNDQVYFAYCYPYTYTDLLRYLKNMEILHSDCMKRKTLCYTIKNNEMQIITITNPNIYEKKIIWITARVHPGETVSSFICESIMTFLLSNNIEAVRLRDQFIIKIVPMLNPDGVINGNYRTSLTGYDLNRIWNEPSQRGHPQIYSLKQLMMQSTSINAIYIDLHAHSKKKSSFFYGCHDSQHPKLTRQIPYLFSKNCKYFNYLGCNFNVCQSKEGTSRVTVFKQCGIIHSYTYEISFCGPLKQNRHFNLQDYTEIAISLCKLLDMYLSNKKQQLKVHQIVSKILNDLEQNHQLLEVGVQQTHGSSSDLEIEEVKTSSNKLQIKRNIIRPRYKFGFSLQEDDSMINTFMRSRKNKSKLSQSYFQSGVYKNREQVCTNKINIKHQFYHYELNSYASSSLYTAFTSQKKDVAMNQIQSYTKSQSNKQIPFNAIDTHSLLKNNKYAEYNGILLPKVSKNYRKYKRKQSRNGEVPQQTVSNQIIRVSSHLKDMDHSFNQNSSILDRLKIRKGDNYRSFNYSSNH